MRSIVRRRAPDGGKRRRGLLTMRVYDLILRSIAKAMRLEG